MLDPAHGPLIAARMNILTRKILSRKTLSCKTFGGLNTGLDSRVFGQDGAIIEGLYAFGEVADFGGMQGYGFARVHLPRRVPLLGAPGWPGGGEGAVASRLSRG